MKVTLAPVRTLILEASHYCIKLFLLFNDRFQDGVGGLQVQSKNSWIDATPIKDTILYFLDLRCDLLIESMLLMRCNSGLVKA
jgi:hypothetical protein